MDIFEHIKKEHREVEQMLEKLSSGFDTQTFDRLKLSLKAHIEAEEQTLYPAMRPEEEKMVQHATEEHRKISDLLGDMDRESKEGTAFTSKVDKLTKVIDDHVKDEEDEMLPKARDMFDQGKVKELSSKFDEVDERVMQRAG